MASPEKINRINAQWQQHAPSWEQESLSSNYAVGPESYYEVLDDDENIDTVIGCGWHPGLEDTRYHRGAVMNTDRRIIFVCNGRCPEYEPANAEGSGSDFCSLIHGGQIQVLSLPYETIEILTDNSVVFATTVEWGDLWHCGVTIHGGSSNYKIRWIDTRSQVQFINSVWHNIAKFLRSSAAAKPTEANRDANPANLSTSEIPTAPTYPQGLRYREMLSDNQRNSLR